MISDSLTRRAEELAAEGLPFVTATVVRVQRPTSAEPGNVALVRSDGTIEEGFVGGVCAQHSVRLYALRVIESGEPLLLKIEPDPENPVDEDIDPAKLDAGEEIAREEGAVTVRNPCLSGGAIEIFLEPVLPAPRVLVAGDSPIVRALLAIGRQAGLDMVQTAGSPGGPLGPAEEDLGLVVAAHGRDELDVLRAGLGAGLPYVGLVASVKRGSAVAEELRGMGLSEKAVARLETPAGLDIRARTPAEIALSIVARIVEVRRSEAAGADSPSGAVTAVDPVCGMTVVVGADTPSLTHGAATVYFCGEGCRRAFAQDPDRAVAG